LFAQTSITFSTAVADCNGWSCKVRAIATNMAEVRARKVTC